MRTSLLLRGFIFFSMVVVASLPKDANAQTSPKTSKPDRNEQARLKEAARLKLAADALMDQDRHVDALALYAKAYELSSDPALLYNQGRALESMGEYAEALDFLERFHREAPPNLRAKVPGLRALLVDLRGRVATLVVTTNAPSARVLLRDKLAGTVEGELRVRTRAGPARIEVVAEGYQPFEREVNLLAGEALKLEAVLSPKSKDALIVVKTRPNANISIDDKPMGPSPIELRLPAGHYVLKAEARGRETERFPMTVTADERRELDIELRETPSVFSRWWFWTGVGAVVVGSVVGAYALTTERSPDRGTFGSGLITGP